MLTQIHYIAAQVMDHVPLILGLAVLFIFRFVLLSASLWILLKTQDLNYNIPGMLASAALASVFDMIPFVGHAMAVLVLFYCVMKMTESEFIDVRFTVGISYAVMFLMKMMVLSALPGTVPVHARGLDSEPAVTQTAQKTAHDDDDDDATNTTAAVTNQANPTAPLAPTVQPETKVALAATNPPVAMPAVAVPSQFTLKGVMKGPRVTTVMVHTGVRTYSIQVGETLSMATPTGDLDVSLEKVSDNAAVFKIGGKMTTLSLR